MRGATTVFFLSGNFQVDDSAEEQERRKARFAMDEKPGLVGHMDDK